MLFKQHNQHEYFIWILIFFSFIGCKPNGSKNDKVSAQLVYENTVKNTVTILTDIGQGSGFFISKNIIATNYHVVDGASQIHFISNDSDIQHPVKGYVALDKTNDLILLNSDYQSETFLSVSKNEVKPGDKIYAIGSPLGLSKTISEGIISGKRSVEDRKLFQDRKSVV